MINNIIKYKGYQRTFTHESNLNTEGTGKFTCIYNLC